MDLNKDLLLDIERAIADYDEPIELIDGLYWSQKDLDRRIAFYTMNRYLSGNKDKYGRRKPYKQIINDKIELEASRTDPDVSSFDLITPGNQFIKTLILEDDFIQLADKMDLNQTINELNVTYIKNGTVIAKKTEANGELIIESVNWLNATCNQRDPRADFITEAHEMTLDELEEKQDVWDNIDEVVAQAEKDKMRIVEVIEAEGFINKAIITEEESDDGVMVLAGIYYARIGKKKVMLFSSERKESIYKIANRKPNMIGNRARGLGLTEEGMEAQISVNEAAILQNLSLTYSGMVISKTNSENVEAQLARGIESGSTIKLEDNEYFESETLNTSNQGVFNELYQTWESNWQANSGAYEAATGEEGKVTPFRSLALKAKQASTTFDYRGEEFNELIKDIIKDWVLPFVVKDLKKEHKLKLRLVGYKGDILRSEIAKYKTTQAKKKAILTGQPISAEDFGATLEEESVRQRVRPDSELDIPKSFYDDLLEDVQVIIGDDLIDVKAKMNALFEIWQTKDPSDPTRAIINDQMIELSNAVSPLEVGSPVPATGQGGDKGGQGTGIAQDIEGLLTNSQQ